MKPAGCNVINDEGAAAIAGYLGVDVGDDNRRVARVLCAGGTNVAVQQADVNGHLTRMRWTVDNRARQKKVEFETVEARYDQNLGDALFTRDQLKQIATR